jgi:hypothetical protein
LKKFWKQYFSGTHCGGLQLAGADIVSLGSSHGMDS